MDLSAFLINILNKIEPITNDSQSVLRISIANHFSEQENLMENHKKASEFNFDLEKKILEVPLDLPQIEYNQKVNTLKNQFKDVPKVGLYTKFIAFFSKPMAKLGLYILFILLSTWLTKRFLSKSLGDEDDYDNDLHEERKPSKKERKILKKFKNYEQDSR
jgi:hypothetical protein